MEGTHAAVVTGYAGVIADREVGQDSGVSVYHLYAVGSRRVLNADSVCTAIRSSRQVPHLYMVGAFEKYDLKADRRTTAEVLYVGKLHDEAPLRGSTQGFIVDCSAQLRVQVFPESHDRGVRGGGVGDRSGGKRATAVGKGNQAVRAYVQRRVIAAVKIKCKTQRRAGRRVICQRKRAAAGGDVVVDKTAGPTRIIGVVATVGAVIAATARLGTGVGVAARTRAVAYVGGTLDGIGSTGRVRDVEAVIGDLVTGGTALATPAARIAGVVAARSSAAGIDAVAEQPIIADRTVGHPA